MNKLLKPIVIVVTALIAIVAGFAGYVFAISPATIRSPQLEHLHFRMQVVVDGKAENFADSKYQEESPKDVCSGSLPEHPIHFHDSKDQFVHIHWKNMTGGMVMKYYGWNYIGGLGSMLGYRLDTLPQLQTVPIHGAILPRMPSENKIYIYMGDEKGFRERNFEDWKNQPLEQFFGQKSNFPGASSPEGETEEGKLKRLNNLIGNVVIFVQKDQPTDAQIKQRFDHLEPLSKSTCAG